MPTTSARWIENNGIAEADAVIAVSQETRNDVLRCFPGVDPGEGAGDPQRHRPAAVPQEPRRGRAGQARGRSRDGRYVLFVGRITRQKGIIHLVNAIPEIDPSIQVVLCAGRAGHAGDRPGDGRVTRWPQVSAGAAPA